MKTVLVTVCISIQMIVAEQETLNQVVKERLEVWHVPISGI